MYNKLTLGALFHMNLWPVTAAVNKTPVYLRAYALTVL